MKKFDDEEMDIFLKVLSEIIEYEKWRKMILQLVQKREEIEKLWTERVNLEIYKGGEKNV